MVLQELFVCKYLWPALTPLLSNPGKLMNREHRSTARGGHVPLCILGLLNLELLIFCFFQNGLRTKCQMICWLFVQTFFWHLAFCLSHFFGILSRPSQYDLAFCPNHEIQFCLGLEEMKIRF